MCLLCDAGSDETRPAELTTLNSFGTSHLKEQAVGESPQRLASPVSSLDQPRQDSVGRHALPDQAANTGRSSGQHDRPAVPASVFGSSAGPAASEQQPTGLQVPASAFGSSLASESGEQQQAQPSVPASAFGGSSESASREQQQGRPSMPASAFGSSDPLAETGGPMVLPTSPFEQARTSGTAAASLGAAQQSSARAVNAQGLELRPSKNVLPPKSSFAAEEVQAFGLDEQARGPPGQAAETRPSKNVLPPKSSFAADEVQVAGLEAEARATRGQALEPRASKNVLPPKSSFAAEEVQAMGLHQGSEGSPAEARGLQGAEMPASGFATPKGGDSPLREGGQEPQAPAAAAQSAGAAFDQGAMPSQAAEAAHREGQAGPASGAEPASQPGTADGSIRRWGRTPAVRVDHHVHQVMLGAAEWTPCCATMLAGLPLVVFCHSRSCNRGGVSASALSVASAVQDQQHQLASEEGPSAPWQGAWAGVTPVQCWRQAAGGCLLRFCRQQHASRRLCAVCKRKMPGTCCLGQQPLQHQYCHHWIVLHDAVPATHHVAV